MKESTTLQDYYKELEKLRKKDNPESPIPMEEQILYIVKGDNLISFERYEKIVENFKKRFMLQAKILGYKQARQEELEFLRNLILFDISNATRNCIKDRIKQIEEELKDEKV